MDDIHSDEHLEVPGTTGENNKTADMEVTKPSEAVLGGSSADDQATSNPASCDPFAYLQRDEFTSEIFKIEINNLPRRCGIAQLRKKLIALGLKPGKVKVLQDGKYAFVNFRCEEDRQQGLETVNGHEWKGKNMIAKKANPAADPLLKKRKQEAEAASGEPDTKLARVEENSNLPLSERLNLAVSPLWKMPYEEQIKSKHAEINQFMKRLGRDIEKNSLDPEDKDWIKEQKKKHGGLCCDLQQIKSSPVLNNYRNKCELTIGQSPDGKDKTVGFRLGRYKGGVVSVVEPEECLIIPQAMKQCAKALQHFLQTQSDQPGFDPETKSGNWKMVLIRTNQKNDVMMVVVFCPQKLSEEVIVAEKLKLQEYFTAGDGAAIPVKSLYFQRQSPRHELEEESSCEILKGDEHIEENLMGLKFRISTNSFFQVNTAAAEVLYKTVADWCTISPNTILLDICCGTGTIGLTMAKRVKKVIGIEMCKEAVEDAKANAKANGMTNTYFHCGKAETLLPSIISHYYKDDVVAVVDPPRAGLHADVVRAIRKCTGVQRLVYVSCKATGALANLLDFTRTESRRVKGDPFRLVQAVPVDLFPHTPHVELVMLFQRGKSLHSESTGAAALVADAELTGVPRSTAEGENMNATSESTNDGESVDLTTKTVEPVKCPAGDKEEDGKLSANT